MGFFDNLRKIQEQQMRRQMQHRDSVAPWEKYAQADDREQGWYCNHDHHESECED